MAIDINKIKQRYSSLQKQTKRQDSFWKPASGKSVIRIVPYKYNKDNPFIELLFHYEIGGKSYLSPKTFGRPDPFSEFSEKLKQSGSKDDYKLAKDLTPKLRTFVPVVVRGEEDKGIRFWGFGKTVYQELLGIIADPEYGDITDETSGSDITVEFRTAAEAGKSFPTTSIRVKRDRSPLVTSPEMMKKLLEDQKDILEIYKELSYDELKDVLEKWLNPPEEELDGAATEAPEDAEENVPSIPVVAKTVSLKQPVKSNKPLTAVTDPAEMQKKFDEIFNEK